MQWGRQNKDVQGGKELFSAMFSMFKGFYRQGSRKTA
jgi:hypothetical protein